MECRWIDIEDEPEWGEELDITAFPTLAVKAGDRTLFAGAVEPHVSHIQRLLTSLSHGI